MFLRVFAVASLLASFLLVAEHPPLCAANPDLLPELVAQAKDRKDERVKASVTGAGKTRFDAENDAARNARSVAGSSTYTVLRRNTTGSGTNWVCTMVIEYTRR